MSITYCKNCEHQENIRCSKCGSDRVTTNKYAWVCPRNNNVSFIREKLTNGMKDITSNRFSRRYTYDILKKKMHETPITITDLIIEAKSQTDGKLQSDLLKCGCCLGEIESYIDVKKKRRMYREGNQLKCEFLKKKNLKNTGVKFFCSYSKNDLKAIELDLDD